MESLTLKLRGMSYAACATAVEQAIANVSGVAVCQVNFALEQATVQYDLGQVDLAKMQQVMVLNPFREEALKQTKTILSKIASGLSPVSCSVKPKPEHSSA